MKIYWFLLSLVLASFSYSQDADLEKDFQRALALSQQGMEDQAQQSWIDFLRRYPSHPKTDEAYYYLGEIYFRKGQFKEANIELARVFLFPSSAKLAEAAVLIGESYQKNHQEKEARIYWQSVLRRFPKTPMASKARNLLLAIGVDQP